MRDKLLKGIMVTVLLLGLTIVKAQNARIDALGGNFSISDVSLVIGNPSASVSYGDVVQMTGYGDGTAGTFIGIKSIGKWAAIGLAANQGSYLSTAFYSDSKELLDSIVQPNAPLQDQFPPIPHLLIGVGNATFSAGIDLYYERSSAETNRISLNGSSVQNSAKLSNTGVCASVGMQLSKFGIYPFASYSHPEAKGKLDTAESVLPVEIKTANSSAFSGGVEMWYSRPAFDVMMGGAYTQEMYQIRFKQLLETFGPKNSGKIIDLWGGVHFRKIQHLQLSLAYSFQNGMYEKNSQSDDPATETRYAFEVTTHDIIGSGEYTIPVNGFFDVIALRIGGVWSMVDSTYRYGLLQSGVTQIEENVHYPKETALFGPTFGCGIKKSIFQLDVAVNLSGWKETFAGPPVLSATITVGNH